MQELDLEIRASNILTRNGFYKKMQRSISWYHVYRQITKEQKLDPDKNVHSIDGN